MIDIIIPTMWVPEEFLNTIDSYCSNNLINTIIIIDNNRSARTNSSILKNKKIKIIDYGKNVYVNKAWNEGVVLATTKIIGILNDDIKIDKDVFEMVLNYEIQPKDLIGVNLVGRQNNFKIDDFINTTEKISVLNYIDTEPIGGQAWAFGICMFMQRLSYTPIPSLYQIWYGDDYLAQRAKRILVINSNKIKGKISETLTKFNDKNGDIKQRMVLDSKNLLKFEHFKNGKNWDIPNYIIKQSTIDIKRYNVKGADILQEQYLLAKDTPSDINENLYILYDLAKKCESIVEMGVRYGVSTRAFLNTNAKLISYDLYLDKNVQKLFDVAKTLGKDVKYLQNDVLKISIDEVDLLFIDTYHTYNQLKQELKLHGNKAQKFIVFHDTFTYGLRDETGKGIGLLPAILEFMIDNPQWRVKLHKTNNNGLTVLENFKGSL